MPKNLIEGFKRFRRETFPHYRERYRELVDRGQAPATLFIGCADSRVLPSLITDSDPGDLFVVRNVGAMVPPHDPGGAFHGTAAGVEFAVSHLGVTDIVVCGHSHCGAMRALYGESDPASPHLTRWLTLAEAARLDGEPTAETLRRTEQRSIALQVERLTTYPEVARRVDDGSLALHGWHYVIEDGQLLALDVEEEAFLPLD